MSFLLFVVGHMYSDTCICYLLTSVCFRIFRKRSFSSWTRAYRILRSGISGTICSQWLALLWWFGPQMARGYTRTSHCCPEVIWHRQTALTQNICHRGGAWKPNSSFTHPLQITRNSSVHTVTGLDNRNVGFDSWQGQDKSLFPTASGQILGHTEPPLLWLP
jgi:hypothetical protein